MRKLAATALLFTLPALASTHPRHHTKTTSAAVRTTPAKKTVAATHHEGMAPERATEIQSALIKSGYLTGEPSGQWDAESTAAMQKLQSDNGWQTKFTPDARALNKLGLSGAPPASEATPADVPAPPR